eukprot:g8403.t1
MLTIFDRARTRDCEGVSRRDFLQAGTLGFGGLSLPWLLGTRALAAESGGFVHDKAVVLLFLSGGASHIETFNPNMTAPAPYCSMTDEVQTKVPGVTFGGTFPMLARNAEKMAIVRSFRHPIGGHVQAIKHVLNGGTDPAGRGERGFSIGSAYARMRGPNHPRTGLPTYALLNSPEVDGQYRSERGRVEKGSHPGSLGASYAPFNPSGKGAAVENMKLNIDRARLDDRRGLMRALDELKQQTVQAANKTGFDRYREQAFDLVLGTAADAFDLTKEKRSTIERYDTSKFRVGKKRFRNSLLGQHMLTARRLIESGCGFVTVHSAGWDMHSDGNNPGIISGMEMLGRPVDRAVSAFLEDLADRGMSEKVLLVITGDFGRTPKVNQRGGRDHWANLCTLAFAGGGLNVGQTIGRSAPRNDVPASEPVNALNLYSTVMHTLFDGCWVDVAAKQQTIDLAAMNKLIGEAKAMGNTFFGIVGGEPFMHPELFEILESHPDCYFQVFTNGQFITDEKAKRLKKMGNVTPLISVEGSEIISDERRGRKGVLSKTMEGVHNALNNNLLTGVCTSVCKTNFDDLATEEWVDELIKMGVFYTWFHVYRPMGPDASPELCLTPEQQLSLRKFVVEMRAKKPIVIVDAYFDGEGQAICPAANGISHHINPWGGIEPCPIIQFATDNIHDDSKPLFEKFNSPFLKEFRELAQQTTRGCIVLERPDLLENLVTKHEAPDGTVRQTALQELQAMEVRTSQYNPGNEIREKSWVMWLVAIDCDAGEKLFQLAFSRAADDTADFFHMGTPRSYRFRPAVNQRWAAIKQQMAAIDAAFLLHGGDLTRDGELHEFEYQQAREDLETLPFPTFVIPGNMDVGNKHTSRRGTKRPWDDTRLKMTAERLDLFASYFGPIHWTFAYRDVRFTGMFAAVAGTGLPQEERLWRMLERLPALPPVRHHVAMMHYWPFIEQPDEPAWDITDVNQYDNWYFSIDPPHRERLLDLLKKAGVEILFCGHVHTGRPVQTVDGIRIYRTAAAGNTSQLADRWPEAETRVGFHRCDVTPTGIEVAFIPGADQCEEFGTFGPWGHPDASERDYSLAEESPAISNDR